MTLSEFFAEHPRVAIAFSGGVDSAYLLYAAKTYAREVHAYFVKSEFQPAFELADSQQLCHELSVPLTVLTLKQLEDPKIQQNCPLRCYYCKRNIMEAIGDQAKKDGFTTLCDGTNQDDKAEDRPGFRALQELGLRSPLRECGLGKNEIRRRSKEAGLFTHDKAAYACLATRIPTGEILTEEKLQVTELAEGLLYNMGFRDFRIRCRQGVPQLQIPQEQFPLYEEKKDQIHAQLMPLYGRLWQEPEVR
jgi:uncharacterized protein